MLLDIWSGATLGQRENQEDWHAIRQLPDEGGLLFVVADGMGGHAAGEIASQTAGSSFVKSFASRAEEPAPARLFSAAQDANRAIAELVQQDPSLDGMGTTLLAGWLVDSQLYWVSIGDSRLFRAMQGKMVTLNADHSYGAWLDAEANAGRLDPQKAASNPDRSALLSCVTGDEINQVEVSQLPLKLAPGDTVLAASDGIDTLAQERIRCIVGDVSNGDASGIGKSLMDAIDDEGHRHQDNTTLIVLRLR